MRRASYVREDDEIRLGWGWAAEDYFHWVAAHEYGHAYHHLALGGLWETENCDLHFVSRRSSYTCALQEGFANYAGTVGSVSARHPDGYLRECFEWFGSLKAPEEPGWANCRDPSHDRRAEVEGCVAALFVDLIDGEGDYDERGDRTEYPAHYIATVFRSCEVKQERTIRRDYWEMRNDVSDIVWCLENDIEEAYHEPDSVFDGIDAPEKVHRYPLNNPPGWNQADIRKTWLWNLN